MAQLTVKEKEHWKERISRKVDQAIENLLVAKDKHYLTRINDEAHQLAIDSLGLRDMQTKLKDLDCQEESLREERKRIYKELDSKQESLNQERQRTYKAMVVKATGRRIEGLPQVYYALPLDIGQAIDERTRLHERELLEKDELGQQVLELRREKEEILDTVWLATSGKHIRELWSSVSELLKESPTPLQTRALSIEPPSEQN